MKKVQNKAIGTPGVTSNSLVNEATPAKRSIKNPSNYIFKAQLARIKQNALTWRLALNELEQAWYPQRVKIQQLYLDTVINGHVEACMKKRKDLTLLKKFSFVNSAGEEDTALTEMFRKSWFYNYMSYALDAPAYGYSLISFGDIINDGFPKLNIIPRENVSPERMQIQHFMYSITGLRFDVPELTDDTGNRIMDWVSWIPTPSENGKSNCGNGYLYKVGIYEIFLRNLLGYNGDFVELYAQPYRVGKTDKTEGDERDLLEAALREMGSAGYCIIDPTDEIEFKETKLGGTGYMGYDNLEKRLEAKVSKVILHHASALDETPGKLGNPEDVQKALEEVQLVDNRFFEDHMNEIGNDKFRNLGFNIPFGYKFIFQNDEEKYRQAKKQNETNLEVATIAKTMKDAGMKMKASYFTERTGIEFEEIEEPAPVVNDFGKKLQNKLDKLYR